MFAALFTVLWRLRVALFLVYSVIFCYEVFRPDPPQGLFANADKVLHVIGFVGLAGASAWAAHGRRHAWVIWPLLFAAAPVVEWLQHVVQPVRQFSTGDIAANLAGVVLGALLWWLCRPLVCRGMANPAVTGSLRQ